ncbi:cupin domain-containing protein [Pantoea ananatis]|uniref:cupin domain-containing protein n=1 Tax=Pantoea ananas TaxID=553 RepID=UPI000D5FD1C9|nr:cupin domain-containing protein [Pantoea ananatis]PVY82438.1 uncharacterized protein YjlB [Pantoea ananatis]
MTAQTSSLMLLMSFAAGTFSAGASNNPQHLMFASPSAGVPNNPLPLIIWPRVVPEDEENIATWFEETFEKNGWPPDWRDQLFPYMHYHPNTHELLGVAEGWAEVLFGGDSGRMITLRAGDALLIPAGVGHRQVSASEDFLAVGAYPEGLKPEILRDEIGQLKLSQEKVKKVPLPKRDPFTGKAGAMTEIWTPVAAMMHNP